ncbi:hypothetical protein SPI_08036 [Niveomyces insectorum RCEF 264]|uniref:Secreted protein n=1 Tax=Niveomyces insectorum RCEF 264 TaxID=1081102 RepID=A0A167NRB1_9HYPO|nr:hypothetical protein SPI_08036 [Niveomyces insectorum RCEF 264]
MQKFNNLFLLAILGLMQLTAALPTGGAVKVHENDARWLLIGGATCAPKCIEGGEAGSGADEETKL